MGGGELRSNESPEIWVELVDSAKSGAMIKKVNGRVPSGRYSWGVPMVGKTKENAVQQR